MTDSNVPEALHYTAEHEWVERRGPATVRVGITDYAQDALGDVVFVQLPDVGVHVKVGESFAEVESTKSVSDIYGPLLGTVAAVNTDLDSSPELVNSDPYGAGWLVEIEVGSKEDLDAQLADTMDAAGYRAVIDS